MHPKLKEFLDSGRTCSRCRKGPNNFSILYSDEKDDYVTKYGNFCSLYCLINFSQPKKVIIKNEGFGG